MERVNIHDLYDKATAPGKSRLNYGVWYALKKAADANIEGRYERQGGVTFTRFINFRDAAYIQPKLSGGDAGNGMYELLTHIDGDRVEIKYNFNMRNGNGRIDITWIDTAREKEMRDKEEAEKEKAKAAQQAEEALRAQMWKFIMKQIRAKMNDKEILAAGLEEFPEHQDLWKKVVSGK